MAYESEYSLLGSGQPNDSIGTANTLLDPTTAVKTTGDTLIGYLGSSSDVDYYKIVTKGAAVINLSFMTTLSTSSKVWSIALLDSLGQDYLTSPTRSAGAGAQVSGADQADSTAPYTLNVDGLSALPAQGDRFTIATSGADTTIYTVVSATALSAGSSTLTLDKAITTAPADNAYLIFDPVQASIGASTTLTAQVSSAGAYYLKVAKADVASTTEYSLTATVTPTVETDDNNTKEDARDTSNYLLSGVAMTGNLSSDSDVDYWLFTTAKASNFTINFASASGNDASADWSVKLFDWADSTENYLNQSGGLTAKTLSAGTSGSLSVTSNEVGTTKTYVVKVSAAKIGASTGNYTLKVSGTGLDLNDTPSMTVGSVTSSTPDAVVPTGVVKTLPAAASGDGTPITLASLFTASDADTATSSQTLSYKVGLAQPASGDANTTGYIDIAGTKYGFGTGMSSPASITLTQSQMDSAKFYPGTDPGSLTLTLQAVDSLAASDYSSNGSFMQMTLKVVAAGTSVSVSGVDSSTPLYESNADSSDTISIQLGAAPASGETVTVYLEHGSEAAGSYQLGYSTSTLTFNSSNWNIAQNVIITAREDNIKEATQTGKVSFRVLSSDATSGFNGLAVDQLTYTLIDASNHAPTGSVTVSGTATQGQTLTASNTIADSDGLGTITYNWQKSSDGTTWSSTIASGTTFTLTNDQAGTYVRAVATYTDGNSNAESVASDKTSLVANINDAPTVANAITDQTAAIGRVFSFTLPSNTFGDVDPTGDGGTLTYTAALVDADSGSANLVGSGALPSWLTFSNGTFSSTNVTGSASNLFVKVTATDNATTPLSTSDVFKITVASAATGTPVLVTPLADQSATERSAFSYTVASGSFTDTDNTTGTTNTTSALTYTATLANGSALPDWLHFSSSSGLVFSGTPANADVGTISVKLTASDGTLSTSDIFDIAVANVNDAPTGSVSANINSVVVQQGNTLTAASSISDADGTGTLGYQWQSSSATGTPSWSNISGANSTTYKLTQAEVGKLVRVAVSYTDGHGTFESVATESNLASAATVAVANVNDAPVATADTATALEAGGVANATAGTNPTGNLLLNDSDPDTGDTITLAALNGATGTTTLTKAGNYGTLVVTKATGAYTYTVNNDNATVQALRTSSNTLTDTFTYTISDPGGLTSTANLVVTLQGADDAPTATGTIADFGASSSNKIYAGNIWSFTFDSGQFSDIDTGDVLAYTATKADGSALPSWLSFDSATRTFTANGTQATTDSVQVKLIATDLAGLHTDVSFTITPQAVGTSAPTLDLPTAVLFADTAAADTSDSLLAASSTESGTLVGHMGSGSSSQTPLVYGISGGTVSGSSVTKTGVYGTLTVDKSTGAYSFAPDAAAINALSSNATENYTVTVTDTGVSLSASRLLTVSVTGTNDTPTLTTPTAVNYTDTTATDTFNTSTGTLAGLDKDTGATLTYSITGGTDSGTTVTKAGYYSTLVVTKATGAYTLTPNAAAINAAGFSYSPADSYEVTVNDGTATGTATLAVNITGANDTAINDVPKLTTITTFTANSPTEDTPYSITYSALANAADEDDIENHTPISFRIEEVTSGTLTKDGVAVTPGSTTITSTDSVSLVWTPAPNANGTLDAFKVKAVDSLGGVSVIPVQVKVTVAAVADAPTDISLSSNTITENVTVGSGVEIGTLTITDPDVSGNNNVLSLVSGQDSANFSIVDGKLIFTGASPNYEAKSSYLVSVKSTDGALTFTKELTINVIDVLETGFNFSGTVKFWKDSSKVVTGVNYDLIADSTSAAHGTVDSGGLFSHDSIAQGTYALTATKSTSASDTAVTRAITSADALSALKLAVGINPNADSSAVSPYQYLAADANKDHRVTSADALAILKMAVKYTGGYTDFEWLMVPDSVGSLSMSRTSVNLPSGMTTSSSALTLDQNKAVHLVGIVLGDVNGSWAG